MRVWIAGWAVAVLALTFSGVAWAQGPGEAASSGLEGAAATVNGEPISHDLLYKRLMQAPAEPMTGFPVAAAQQAGYQMLRSLIMEKLTLGLAEKLDVLPTQEQLDERIEQLTKAQEDRGQSLEAALERAGMTKADLADRLRPELSKTNIMARYIDIPESQVTSAYAQATTELAPDEKYRSAFYLPEQVRIAAIITETEEQIREAHQKLMAGENFVVVARDYSVDENTKDKGGEVGWVNRPDPARPAPQGVPAEVYDNAFKTDVGQYTQPFQAGGQWVVLSIKEHREARFQPLEHVRPIIYERLLYQKGNEDETVQALFEDYLKQAKVSVTLSAYKDLLDQGILAEDLATPDPVAPSPQDAP